MMGEVIAGVLSTVDPNEQLFEYNINYMLFWDHSGIF